MNVILTALVDSRLYRAVLYGGVGSIMGHELTHGYDVDGKFV